MNCFTPSQIDVEEGTTQVRAGGPFRHQLNGRKVGRELEFVAVFEFVNAFHLGSQLRTKLIEMMLALFRSERRTVAREGRNQ